MISFYFLYLIFFRLQLPQPDHLPDLLHATEQRAQPLPGLLLLPLPGGGQDEPAEPLHALAGRVGGQTGPQDFYPREANIPILEENIIKV